MLSENFDRFIDLATVPFSLVAADPTVELCPVAVGGAGYYVSLTTEAGTGIPAAAFDDECFSLGKGTK